MVAVQIAELKNNLSVYLNKVRAGQEVLIRDRNTPIARILPLAEVDDEERDLVTAGILKLPAKPFDSQAFFAIGKDTRTPKATRDALQRAMDWVREDRDASVLGRQRRRSTKRQATGKRPR